MRLKLFALFLFASVLAFAQGADHTAFNKPFPAFKIIGNVYYVGTDNLATVPDR